MSSMRNFLFEAKSNEVTIENKKEDKKEDKTTATTSTYANSNNKEERNTNSKTVKGCKA